MDVILIDGETGVVEQTVPLPANVVAGYYGIYGGASDGDGNFWGSQLGIGHLVRVDRITFAVETWPMPTSGYGMTVDENGRAWTCSSQVSRFDYPTETWQSNFNAGGSGGCMIDGKGAIWLASNSLVGLDIETMAQITTLAIPSYVHGVSIDYNGNVWGVTLYETFAYRVDPSSGVFDTFDGLTGPYTYSDMTGHGLKSVVAPN
jgi:streptogramin lyase